MAFDLKQLNEAMGNNPEAVQYLKAFVYWLKVEYKNDPIAMANFIEKFWLMINEEYDAEILGQSIAVAKEIRRNR